MKSRRERTVADRRETTVEKGNGGVADAENAAVGGEDGSVGDAGEVMIEDEEMTGNALQESARASRKMSQSRRDGRRCAWDIGMVVAGMSARGVGKRVETGEGSRRFHSGFREQCQKPQNARLMQTRDDVVASGNGRSLREVRRD